MRVLSFQFETHCIMAQQISVFLCGLMCMRSLMQGSEQLHPLHTKSLCAAALLVKYMLLIYCLQIHCLAKAGAGTPT